MEDGKINLSEITFEQPEDQVNVNEPIQEDPVTEPATEPQEPVVDEEPNPLPESLIEDTPEVKEENPAWMS
jgi:hypothetical protein